LQLPGTATNVVPNIGPNPLAGFFLLPSNMPFNLFVSCTLNTTGTLQIALYNFNVFNLGGSIHAIQAALKKILGNENNQ
jgi:hypothetical protein